VSDTSHFAHTREMVRVCAGATRMDLSQQLEQVRTRIDAMERTLSSRPPAQLAEGAAGKVAAQPEPARALRKTLAEQVFQATLLIPFLATALTVFVTWYVKEAELRQQMQKAIQDQSRDHLGHYLDAEGASEKVAILQVIVDTPRTEPKLKSWAEGQLIVQQALLTKSVVKETSADLENQLIAEMDEEGLPPGLDSADTRQIAAEAAKAAKDTVEQAKLVGAAVDVLTPAQRARQLWAKGYAAFNNGELEKARELYVKSQAADPSSARPSNSLGHIALKEGNLQLAEKQFRRSLELQKSYAPAAYNLVLALARQGEHDQAREQLARAIRIGPDYGKRKLVEDEVARASK
jgi:tetratricopeptide (TPR) repeat protein